MPPVHGVRFIIANGNGNLPPPATCDQIELNQLFVLHVSCRRAPQLVLWDLVVLEIDCNYARQLGLVVSAQCGGDSACRRPGFPGDRQGG
jgi:hypothetical protein